MRLLTLRLAALFGFALAASLDVGGHVARADEASVARGKYLVTLAGCGDCHTPGHFFGKPDAARMLGGSDVGFEVPGLGVFVGPNLTPDKETGLGAWSDDDIRKALTTGVRPDGRGLAPPMPWRSFAGLEAADMQAMIDYLRSLPPVSNKVAGPFGPSEKPTVAVMTIVPPAAAQ